MVFAKYDWLVTRLVRVTAGLSIGVGLVSLIVAIILDVTMRWLFNSPITGVRDLSSLFIAVIVSGFFGLLLRQEGNISIRFLGKLLGQRWEIILDLAANVLTMAVMALATYYLWQYAEYLADNGETTQVLGWRMAPWWRVATVLTGISLLAGPVVIGEKIRQLKNLGAEKS